MAFDPTKPMTRVRPECLLDVTTPDLKYRIVQFADGGVLAYRHGEPWRDLVGDGLVLHLAQEMKKGQDLRKAVGEFLDGRMALEGDSRAVPDDLVALAAAYAKEDI